MRINKDFGMLHLVDDSLIIASANWEMLGKDKAENFLEEIKHEYESDKARVREGCNSIDVVVNKKTLLSFYWSKKDKWKYGIRTKEEAIDLAGEFARQYNSEGYRPSSEIMLVKRKSMIDEVLVYDSDDELIATFESSRLADMFLDSINCVAEVYFDPWGLESSSPAWDRSIRHESKIKEIKGIPVNEWILSLMQYMNDNWERCE